MMNVTQTSSWQATNQNYLAIALNDVRVLLQQYVDRLQGNESGEVEASSVREDLAAIASTLLPPPALHTLCLAFDLTPFERDLLLIAAGVELSASLARLCAEAQGSAQLTFLTFSLGLAALPDAHWSALSPARPLRRWRLIEVSNGESLTQSRLRIDERVLHYLNGVFYLDDRLQGLVEPFLQQRELPPTHRDLAQRMVDAWSRAAGNNLVIQLGGEEPDKVAISAAGCAALGLQLHVMRAIDIPPAVAEREALARLWEREAILTNSALLLDCEDFGGPERLRVILPFIETVQSWLIIAGREPLRIQKRPTLRLDANKLSSEEQSSLWQERLGSLVPELNGQLGELVSQFSLSPQAIQDACLELEINSTSLHRDPSALFNSLWETCRMQARTGLDDLAQRIKPAATWDELVLPEQQRQVLREMAAQVKQRTKVYETWEFAVRGANGLGISALFAGVSGTGKTMAAEVLANELRLDLYRVDLSQVVSKYIGETEKNLRRVFEAAEVGGAILLFDEADALFGKRSDVKDSHDRYANIEVSYLLQRMETYRGLAILTTNLRSAIDDAFLRRIRFVVQFPFPDVLQRMEIWRRMFPEKLPTADIDPARLAQLNIPGGNIRNVALNAAFLAADAGEAVQMKHLLRAAQGEYGKLEKTLTSSEVVGWI
jgi:ATPase family associated with various cellular activities (AAA)